MNTSTLKFDASEIADAVAMIVKNGKAMVRGIESVLVMAVYDSIVNESPAVANALMKSLRVSTKKNAIVAFLHNYGKLYAKTDKFVFFGLGAQAKLEWTTEFVAELKEAAMDWESFKVDVEPDAYDVIKAVESVLKKFDSAKKNAAPTTSDTLAPYLRALLAQYCAQEALKAAQASSSGVAAPAVPNVLAALEGMMQAAGASA